MANNSKSEIGLNIDESFRLLQELRERVVGQRRTQSSLGSVAPSSGIDFSKQTFAPQRGLPESPLTKNSNSFSRVSGSSLIPSRDAQSTYMLFTSTGEFGSSSGQNQRFQNYSAGKQQPKNSPAGGAGNFLSTDYESPSDVYVGGWMSDKRHGRGICDYANGNRYEGEWAYDQRHGTGTLFLTSGSRYQGQWVRDEIHGKGVAVYSEGDIFDGEWEHNKRANGSGRLLYANGDIYTGSFVNEQRHGFGELLLVNGDYFRGQFVFGRIQGKGKLIFSDSSLSNFARILSSQSSPSSSSLSNNIKQQNSQITKQIKEQHLNQQLLLGNSNSNSNTNQFRINKQGSYDGEWANGLPHGIGCMKYCGMNNNNNNYNDNDSNNDDEYKLNGNEFDDDNGNDNNIVSAKKDIKVKQTITSKKRQQQSQSPSSSNKNQISNKNSSSNINQYSNQNININSLLNESGRYEGRFRGGMRWGEGKCWFGDMSTKDWEIWELKIMNGNFIGSGNQQGNLIRGFDSKDKSDDNFKEMFSISGTIPSPPRQTPTQINQSTFVFPIHSQQLSNQFQQQQSPFSLIQSSPSSSSSSSSQYQFSSTQSQSLQKQQSILANYIQTLTSYDSGEIIQFGFYYEGMWKNNRRFGEGIQRYKNGDCFRGVWIDGFREGAGILDKKLNEIDVRVQNYYNSNNNNSNINSANYYQSGQQSGQKSQNRGSWMFVSPQNSSLENKSKQNEQSPQQNQSQYNEFFITPQQQQSNNNNNKQTQSQQQQQQQQQSLFQLQYIDLTGQGCQVEGVWKHGKINGDVIIRFKNGDIDFAQFEYGIRNRRGKRIFSNGDSYTGEFAVVNLPFVDDLILKERRKLRQKEREINQMKKQGEKMKINEKMKLNDNKQIKDKKDKKQNQQINELFDSEEELEQDINQEVDELEQFSKIKKGVLSDEKDNNTPKSELKSKSQLEKRNNSNSQLKQRPFTESSPSSSSSSKLNLKSQSKDSLSRTPKKLQSQQSSSSLSSQSPIRPISSSTPIQPVSSQSSSKIQLKSQASINISQQSLQTQQQQTKSLITHQTNSFSPLKQFSSYLKQQTTSIQIGAESYPEVPIEGEGIYESQLGDIYEGSFSRGVPNGFGILKRRNGDVYRGQWINGKEEGDGVCIYAAQDQQQLSQQQYQQQLIQQQQLQLNQSSPDIQNGVTSTFLTSPYNNSQISAQKTKTNQKSISNINSNSNSNINNNPTIINKDIGSQGGMYKGEWKSGKWDGFGELRLTNGEIYIGQFQKGKKQGRGRMEFSDGSVYDGFWANNKRQGDGAAVWVRDKKLQSDLDQKKMIRRQKLVDEIDQQDQMQMELELMKEQGYQQQGQEQINQQDQINQQEQMNENNGLQQGSQQQRINKGQNKVEKLDDYQALKRAEQEMDEENNNQNNNKDKSKHKRKQQKKLQQEQEDDQDEEDEEQQYNSGSNKENYKSSQDQWIDRVRKLGLQEEKQQKEEQMKIIKQQKQYELAQRAANEQKLKHDEVLKKMVPKGQFQTQKDKSTNSSNKIKDAEETKKFMNDLKKGVLIMRGNAIDDDGEGIEEGKDGQINEKMWNSIPETADTDQQRNQNMNDLIGKKAGHVSSLFCISTPDFRM